MKVTLKGSSKISGISENKETKKSKEKTENKTENEKLADLVTKAEVEHLIPEEVIDVAHEELPKSKVQKLKRATKDFFDKTVDKTKPHIEKHKQLLSTAVVKARALHPYVDRTITTIDNSITYIARPNPLDDQEDVVQTTRPPAVFGIWVMIFTFGFAMMWAFLAPLNSASHAIGKIILDSKKRIIQHPEGGVIKEILVRDGQEVTKGQTLIILDDTQLKARKQQYEYRYLTSLAEVARLTAEKDGAEEIKFPEELLSRISDPEVPKMIQTQEKLFNTRKIALAGRVEQYIERRNSVIPQIEANEKIVKITAKQVESYVNLYKKNNVSLLHLQDAQTRHADAVGRVGALKSQLAETEQAIGSAKHDFFERVVTELKDQQAQLSVNSEALKEIAESLARTVITAPEAGVVSSFNENLTPKGIIPVHGQTLMEIIPQDDELVIEARIPAQDIAPVKVGQTCRVRLTAYRARIIPAIEGKLVSLSPDLVYPEQRDLQSGLPPQPYYRARIVIDKKQLTEIANVKDVALYPGMGVDVMIVVGTRTMMNYLMDPIIITLDHAFRER